jgi:hypothetical protein
MVLIALATMIQRLLFSALAETLYAARHHRLSLRFQIDECCLKFIYLFIYGVPITNPVSFRNCCCRRLIRNHSSSLA